MTAIVTGADSGLGACLCHQLLKNGTRVIPVGGPNSDLARSADLTDLADIDRISSELLGRAVKLVPQPTRRNVLVNCAGMNYIEWFPDLDMDMWDKVNNLNARAPVALTKALLPWLKDGTVVNIVSNASHMAMTNSVAYNASKGAAHIATLAMARELGKTHGMTVFGVSPNKLRGTRMSAYIDDRVPGLRGWTEEQAHAYQLAGLPAGAETPPERLAEFIAFLLSDHERHRYLHATVIPYGGPT